MNMGDYSVDVQPPTQQERHYRYGDWFPKKNERNKSQATRADHVQTIAKVKSINQKFQERLHRVCLCAASAARSALRRRLSQHHCPKHYGRRKTGNELMKNLQK
jgi:hypothetical protein